VRESVAILRQNLLEAVEWYRLQSERCGTHYTRTEYLIESNYELAFRPENYDFHRISQIVDAVIVQRRLHLQLSADVPFSGLDGGRLLRHNFGETTFTDEANLITHGFIDEFDVPPWDVWVGMVRDIDFDLKRPAEYLISWIPSVRCDEVNEAVRVSFEENILWLDTCKTALTRTLFDFL
jgi:hypothetical protein